MFTGIIELLGEILALQDMQGQARLRIKPLIKMRDLQKGESIAVNGVCLTVETFGDDWFEVYASFETIKITNLQRLHTKALVNLERALLVGQRFGGHFVTGHIDTVAQVQKAVINGESKQIRFSYDEKFSDFFAPKGGIALDGISLTVNQCGTGFLEVNIIPATLANTTICNWRDGYTANLEVDVLSRYVKAQQAQANTKINMQFLAANGFEYK
jgi:riboflavin synthase